uniref:RHS repeat-associated core domain-containing protein n=1 Tax=Streptosporangium sp. OZ121 TaxID=3444183 RepID=UPI003F7A118F
AEPLTEQRYHQTITYAKNDLIDTISEQLGDTSQPTATTTYSYDQRHQLTTAIQQGGAGYYATFSHHDSGRLAHANITANADPAHSVGRRLKARNVTYTYQNPTTPNTPNPDPQRLAALHTDDGTDTGTDLATYTYDEAGNTTTRTLADGTTATQTWDGPRLRKVTTASGSETYFYDGATRIAALHHNPQGTLTGVRRSFGAQEVLYTPGQPATYRQTIGLGGQTIGRLDTTPGATGTAATPTFEHYTTSIHGHHVLALSEAGDTQRVASYGAHGEVLQEKTAANLPVPAGKYPQQFNGKDYTPHTELTDYGYRSYDSLSLTWTSADPLYQGAPDRDPANPRAANLYDFTGNDPINRIDPNGLDDIPTQPGETI